MILPPAIDQEVFYARLLESCRTEGEKAVCMLLWRTGMHASTLVEQDWVLFNCKIQWRRPKTGKKLVASLPPSDVKLLERCINGGSLPNSYGILRRWLGRIGERAGYPGLTALTLRHSRAVYLLDGGIPPHGVSRLLGCSWAVLEKHYSQIEEERLVKKEGKE